MLRKKLRRLIPYWLRGHDFRCTECGATHAHAVEARCVACDQPHCPLCVVMVDGEVFCSTCAPEGRPKPWRRARSGKA